MFSGCSQPSDCHQLFSDPAIGDNLSMPTKHQDSVIFAEKNDFLIEGREVEGMPTIMFGVKF
jgi:hypothetical protein